VTLPISTLIPWAVQQQLFVVVTAEVTDVVVASVFAYNNAANFANLSKPLITFCNEEV